LLFARVHGVDDGTVVDEPLHSEAPFKMTDRGKYISYAKPSYLYPHAPCR
jgi:hypothetical protein